MQPDSDQSNVADHVGEEQLAAENRAREALAKERREREEQAEVAQKDAT